MKMQRSLLLGWMALLLAFSYLACQPIVAPEATVEEVLVLPSRVLFLGTSLTDFNGGIDMHLQELCDSADPEDDVEIDRWTMMAGSLAKMTEHPHVHRQIQEGYDMVVLQASDQGEAGNVEAFLAAASELDAEITATGADTALLLLWEMPEWNDITLDEYLESHRAVAAQLDARLVPVGLAFQRVEDEHPEIELQWWDGHATLHGTYLAAAVFYSALFGESPEGLAYLPDPSWSQVGDPVVTPEQAALLQQAAWQTVQEFNQ